MMKWADFIMHGNPDVLSDALLDEIKTGQVPEYPEIDLSYYGYGLGISRGFPSESGEWYETEVLAHDGGTMSFLHQFFMFPEHDLAFSICASSRDIDLTHSISTAATTLIDLGEPSPPPVPTPDPAKFSRHVGTYNDPWGVGEVVVTKEGDALLVEIPALTAAGFDYLPELYPQTSTIFLLVVDGEPMDITFIPEEEDGPSIYARNRDMVAVRVEPEGKSKGALASRKAAVTSFMERRRIPFEDSMLRWSAVPARLLPGNHPGF